MFDANLNISARRYTVRNIRIYLAYDTETQDTVILNRNAIRYI